MKTYAVKEIFYSLQGEGARAGTPNVFIRFAGCNMQCELKASTRSPGGFVCDTDFQGGEKYTRGQLVQAANIHWSTGTSGAVGKKWCVLTGGEPGLQIDTELLAELKLAGWSIAIETNGTVALPDRIDWVCVSPKVPDIALTVKQADEAKFVVSYGHSIPKTTIEATHYILSPAFMGNELDGEVLKWCIGLVQRNPKWRLSVQQHKLWGVR